MTNATNGFVINWEESEHKAYDKLKYHYEVSGDYDAMRDGLVDLTQTPEEAAEAWIESAIEGDYYNDDETEAEYTDDKERCIKYYTEFILESLEQDGQALYGILANQDSETDGFVDDITAADQRHSSEGGSVEDYNAVKLGRWNNRWYVLTDSGGGCEVQYAGDDEAKAREEFSSQSEMLVDNAKEYQTIIR